METTIRSKGRLFIISAPSGTGKTTLCRRLLEYYPDMAYSISYTTRRPRSGEKDGKDYHFISREDFLEKRALDYWAEWARVHDHYYGTSAVFLSDSLTRGRHVLMDIDVQGAMQILTRFPEAVTIFIMPPSMDVLRQRLTQRGTDSHGTIQKRLRNAAEEMEKRELYRHIIVNDQLERAVEELLAVVKQCREGGT